MSQVKTKHPLLSHRVKVILALGIILFFVVLAFFLPSEGDSNNITGDSAATPTVSITNPVGTLTVNRAADVNGIHITVTHVQEAAAFSDDREHGGKYTVRVYVHTLNSGQIPIGIDYSSQVRLLLPGGQVIAPKFITVAPVALPKQKQDGFFDFPVTSQVDLPPLGLRWDNKTTVTFSG